VESSCLQAASKPHPFGQQNRQSPWVHGYKLCSCTHEASARIPAACNVNRRHIRHYFDANIRQIDV
jgi:hypothetical protein